LGNKIRVTPTNKMISLIKHKGLYFVTASDLLLITFLMVNILQQ